MKLEEIGFYTLSDHRAKTANVTSPLHRCELILTDACNFNCTYCRPMREDCQGTIGFLNAADIITQWSEGNLKNLRFSGGEPTLYRDLDKLVSFAKGLDVRNIAVSTNGSAPLAIYDELIAAGVTDFSVSFDACCSSTADKMAGRSNVFNQVCKAIEYLAKRVYTTVGVVLTEDNIAETYTIITLASGLGVDDIRIIPAAHYKNTNGFFQVPEEILSKHPILRYRLRNVYEGNPVRGLRAKDTIRCPLVLDDMAVASGYHFPCIIYFRERGEPIGSMNQSIKAVRQERLKWFHTNRHLDPICSKNCLDVCVEYNNKWERFHV